MSNETGIAHLIPQIFFDIIARVIPGVFLLLIFILVYLGFDVYWMIFSNWLGPTTSMNSQLGSATILFLLSFITAYSLSISLWGIRYKITEILLKISHKSTVTDCETGIDFISKDEKEKFYINRVLIKEKNPVAGARITKINLISKILQF